MAKTRPVMIMAGGTGGHVFPALAVARELLSRNIPVVWLGTRKGLEARIVPAEGIPIEWLSVGGLRGKKMGRLLMAPFMLVVSILQALWIMGRHRPRVVLGMGGFVTGPGGLAARLTFRPLCIHEQNAIAGLTNRLLARIAHRVFEAFPHSFAQRRDTQLTGNPVRQEIAAIAPPEQRFLGRTTPLQVLVLGGSLGADAINKVLPQALARLTPPWRPRVRHQAGERNLDKARGYYREAGIEVELSAFINDMAEAYAWADLVVCRAGALTLAELAAAGVGAILIPFPFAVDDHQTANARYFTQAGAGMLIPQDQLDADQLAALIKEFSQDRGRLLQWAQAARALAITDSAKQVADGCLQLASN